MSRRIRLRFRNWIAKGRMFPPGHRPCRRSNGTLPRLFNGQGRYVNEAAFVNVTRPVTVRMGRSMMRVDPETISAWQESTGRDVPVACTSPLSTLKEQVMAAGCREIYSAHQRKGAISRLQPRHPSLEPYSRFKVVSPCLSWSL